MMPIKSTNKQKAAGLVMCFALLLSSTAAHAAGTKDNQITIGEIALYVGLIVALIGVAWLWAFKGKQSESHPPQNAGHSHHHHHHAHGKYHGKHHRR